MNLTLSKAEINVGCLLALGYSKKEIAAKRNASVSTIRHQTESIYLKTNSKNLADITRFMISNCTKFNIKTLLIEFYLKSVVFYLLHRVVSVFNTFLQKLTTRNPSQKPILL